jgi:uncharacterized membrane protein
LKPKKHQLQSDTQEPKPGAPQLAPVTRSHLLNALAHGWSDLCHAPKFGLAFSAFFVLIGWLLLYITVQTGTTFWLILAAFGFPLLGPFAAVGLYEVSRRLETGQQLNWPSILGVMLHQRTRSLPMMGAIVVVIFLFWFFLAHMIFALFLGLSTMTNISSSFAVFLTPNGLAMIAIGASVGAIFALLLFMITVLGLPMVLDREVDFVTAMASSFAYVAAHPLTMFGWAVLIATITLASMLPLFLGLLVAMPILGHASWHLYSSLVITSD